MPMMEMFDRGIRCGWASATCGGGPTRSCRCSSGDDDPLGVEDLRTHRMPLDEAPQAYEMFQKKEDGCIKVVLEP